MAALGREDVEAFVAGRLTLDDLAAKAGVSKQAASKWLRRRGLGRASATTTTCTAEAKAASAGAGIAAPAPTPTEPAASSAPFHPSLIGLDQDPDALRRIATGALIAIIARSNLLLAGAEPLGPSALKAVTTAVIDAAGALTGFGVLPPALRDDDTLTKLIVRQLTDVEEQTIRDHQDAEAGGDFESPEARA